MNAFGVQLAGKFAMADNVCAPELFQPPRCHCSGIDGAYVGVRHQGQQAKMLDGFHTLGQLDRSRRIAEIP
jgi:hypothetical protein